jgi:hypothetical protein
VNSDTFFTELAAKRRAEQAGQRSAFAIPSGSQVPWALGLAMRHGLLVQPVLAQSRYASASARVGVPDNTREQIEYWAALYRDATACNWELTTGPDSVIGVEIDMRYSDETLRLSPDNVYDDVANTLMWDVGSRRVAVFKYAPDLPRIHSRFADFIKLYSNGRTLWVPPSCLDGEQLTYGKSSTLQSVPPWLRKYGTSRGHSNFARNA